MNRKDELKKQINDWLYEINRLVKIAKQCGNKKPYDNFMIKDRIKIVEKLKKELEALQND